MTVLIPKVNKEGNISECKPIKTEDYMLNSYRRGFTSRITSLVNKIPTWSQSIQGYVLDFGGRVTLPSVKNFQLINPHSGSISFKPIEKTIVMQFGRIDENLFNVDLTWPLSIFQAYGIAISSFSRKYTFPYNQLANSNFSIIIKSILLFFPIQHLSI